MHVVHRSVTPSYVCTLKASLETRGCRANSRPHRDIKQERNAFRTGSIGLISQYLNALYTYESDIYIYIYIHINIYIYEYFKMNYL